MTPLDLMAWVLDWNYSLWVVATLIYFQDSLKLLWPRTILIYTAGSDKLRAGPIEPFFTIAGRAVAWLNPLAPWRSYFIVPWGKEWKAQGTGLEALKCIVSMRAARFEIGFYATTALLFTSAIGPLLTKLLGIAHALTIVVALLYANLAFCAVALWFRRNELNLTRKKVIITTLELTICPILVANILRKITTKIALDVDAAQLILEAGETGRKEPFLITLREHVAQEVDSVGEGVPRDKLLSYDRLLREAM